MGLLQKIGKAEVFGSSRPFAHGRHRVEVSNVILKDGQGKKSTEWFIVEAKVLESDTHHVGEVRSWVVDAGQASGPGNVKGFLLACVQNDSPEATADSMTGDEWGSFLGAAVGKDQPLKGAQLVVEVFGIKTREGNDFSKHVWSAGA